MTIRTTTLAVLGVFVAPAAAEPPRPGDYLIASRAFGSIYAVDPATGLIRGAVSGQDRRLGEGGPVVVGDGPSLGPSFRLSIDGATGGAILARTCLEDAKTWGLYAVDALGGDRALFPGTNLPLWDECGDVIFDTPHAAYSTATGDFENFPGDRGRVLRYDLDSGETTLVSGDGRGDGLGLYSPRGMARLDENTLLALESNLPLGLGAGLYMVDIGTGDRTLLSWMTRVPRERRMIVGGVDTGPVTIGDDEGGAGPAFNRQPRTVCVNSQGRIFVGGAVDLGETFDGGIMEIDPVTGDRTLLVGVALDRETGDVVHAPPTNDPQFGAVDAPIGLLETPSGRLAFTFLFGPDQILEFDPDTRELFVVADLRGLFLAGDSRFSGLAIYWPGFELCDPAEPFGILDFSDVFAFLAAFGASNPIADPAEPFGVFDFSDVLAFISAFGGGCP